MPSKKIGYLDWPDWESVGHLADARDEVSRLYVTAVKRLALLAGVSPDDAEGMKALHKIIFLEAKAVYKLKDEEGAGKAGVIRPPGRY